MIKKQRTKWIFLYRAGGGTYIRIGWMYNKRQGWHLDKVRIQIKSASVNSNMDLYLTVDEALGLVSGIGKVLTVETNLKNIRVKE